MRKFLKNAIYCFVATGLVLGASSIFAAVNHDVRQAQHLFAGRQYEQAIEVYKKQLQLQPNNVNLLLKIAKSYAWSDQHPKAIHYYRQVMRLDEKKGRELYSAIAWQYLWNGQPKKAKVFFTKALLVNHRSVEARLGLLEIKYPDITRAKIHTRQENYAAASKMYAALLAKINEPLLLVDMARVSGKADQHAQAVFLYKKAIQLKPELINSLRLPLAWQLLWNEQYQEAKDLFTVYIKKHPNDMKAKIGLQEASYPSLMHARVNVRKGKYVNAIGQYRALNRRYPSNPLFYTELGKTYARDDQHAKAAASYKRALALSGDPSLHFPIGQQLIWAGKQNEGVKHFYLSKKAGVNELEASNAILEAKSGEYEEYLVRLEDYLTKHKIKKAVQLSRRTIMKDRKNESLYLQTAITFNTFGYRKIGRKILEAGIKAAPKYKDFLLVELAWTYYFIEQKPCACHIAQYLHKKDKKHIDSSLQDLLGYCIDYSDGHKAAIRYYEGLSKKNVDSEYTSWQLRLADIYIDLREYDKAKVVLENLLRNEPYNAQVITLLGNTMTFRDYNMQAARLYRHYLRIMPTNSILREDLARAYYWLELGDKAKVTIHHPVYHKKRRYYQWLDLINRAYSNRFYVYYSHRHDSDGFENNSASMELEHYLSGRTFLAARFSAGHLKNEVSGGWQRFMFGGRTTFGGIDSSYGIIYPAVYVGVANYLGWHPMLWDASVFWKRSDHYKFDIDAENQVVDNSVAFGHDILFNRLLVDANYYKDPWDVHGVAMAGRFTDNNNRYLVRLIPLYNIWRRISLYIGPYAEYFTDSNTREDNGYFNPEYYGEISLLVRADLELGRWDMRPYVKYGYFDDGSDNPISKNRTIDSGLRIIRNFTLHQALVVNVGYLDSGAGSGAGAGGFQGGDNYREFHFSIGYHYYF